METKTDPVKKRPELQAAKYLLIGIGILALFTDAWIYAPLNIFLGISIVYPLIWVPFMVLLIFGSNIYFGFGASLSGGVVPFIAFIKDIVVLGVVFINIDFYLRFISFPSAGDGSKPGILNKISGLKVDLNPMHQLVKAKLVTMHILQYANTLPDPTFIQEADITVVEREEFYLRNEGYDPAVEYPVRVDHASTEGVNIICVGKEGYGLLQIIHPPGYRAEEKNLYAGESLDLFDPGDELGIHWEISVVSVKKKT